MDTRDELKQIAQEKKFGPIECDCDGTCELAFKLAGNVHHYKDIWEKINDTHYDECPTAIAAHEHRKSTLCLCDKIEIANQSAEEPCGECDLCVNGHQACSRPISSSPAPEECLRCHNLAEACRCGAKAQLV